MESSPLALNSQPLYDVLERDHGMRPLNTAYFSRQNREVQALHHTPARVHVPPQGEDLLIVHLGGTTNVSRRIGAKQSDGCRVGSFTFVRSGTDPVFDVRGHCDVLHLYLDPNSEVEDLPQVLKQPDGLFDVRIPEALPLARQIAAWLPRGGSQAAHTVLENLTGALVAAVTDCLTQHSDRRKGGLAPKLQIRVKDRIVAGLSTPLRVSDLARDVQLSEGHFRRAFAETFGLTPQRYIADLRCHHARIGLESGKNPEDVALETGYSSVRQMRRSLRRQRT